MNSTTLPDAAYLPVGNIERRTPLSPGSIGAPGCISSVCGTLLDIGAPKAADVINEDVINAMLHTNRFGGRGKTKSNLLQHSLLVAEMVPYDLRGIALLHDAHEVYLGEIPSPANAVIKARAGFDVLGQIKMDLDKAIFASFGVTPPACDRDVHWIKAADAEALRLERAFCEIGPGVNFHCGPEKITTKERALVEYIFNMSRDELVTTFLSSMQEYNEGRASRDRRKAGEVSA
ncbi:hypothetical protein [Sulfitobacter sp. 1A15106]|uniref:hypothetical protein n=1 Tax=Sulfitobacter sp. 1A15106 TaxID=3368590 RepID=UPI0037459BA6